MRTSGITRRQTLTMHRLEAHRRCPAGFASQGLVLRAPRSLPPMPVPGAAAHHWYKGWETGPWGEEAASGSAQRLLFTPAQEGGGSCQRKWGRIKEGRKGQGQVRGGHRPNSSLQQARPTLGQRGRDPEGGVRGCPSPPHAGVSVRGGATMFTTTTAQLPCFLPAVVGASPWHPIVSDYLVTGGAGAGCVLGYTSDGPSGSKKTKEKDPWVLPIPLCEQWDSSICP